VVDPGPQQRDRGDRDGHPRRGFGYLWREILGVFGGLYRKYTDGARTIEKTENLRRVA
jgi:hypothetical protein